MKKLLFIALIAMSFTTQSDFCSGWEKGYQQALDDCLRVAVTPVCPIEPINSEGFSTGYGYGYAAAKSAHCDD